jgi:hypothetical protein
MRITKETKQIADAHIKARLESTFDDVDVSTKEELIQALRDGKTFSGLLEAIEMKYTSITSILMSRRLFHQSKNYTDGVYKGFKLLLQNDNN